MRTFLVATLLLAAALSAAPAEARPYPVECHAGLIANTCTVDAVVCRGEVVTAYDGSFQDVGASCVGGASCDIGMRGYVPTHQECSLPASGPTYGCEPTPHGMRCTGDLVVCTTYSGAESNGLSYSGFDCGVASCDLLFYQGRLKDSDCSAPVAAGAAAREPVPGPVHVDCLPNTGFTTWCEVDAGVCYYKQTQYHLEDRTVTELRCLGVVDCTWDSGSSAARAETQPFCPVP